ncbi:MAG: hypothetical protein ACYTEV_03915 [Planctomycetota bacterium]
MHRLPERRDLPQPYRLHRRPARAGGLGRLLLGVASAAVTFAVGGCGFLQPPSVTIEGARVVDRSAEAVRFDVTARLRNPNREDSLELRTIRYRVAMDGLAPYPGQRAAQATLAPGGEVVLELPVVVPAAELDPASGSIVWRLEGSLLYIAPGALAETLLDTGVRRPRVGLDGSGTVRLDATDSSAAARSD